jgi:hypothetical protein
MRNTGINHFRSLASICSNARQRNRFFHSSSQKKPTPKPLCVTYTFNSGSQQNGALRRRSIRLFGASLGVGYIYRQPALNSRSDSASRRARKRRRISRGRQQRPPRLDGRHGRLLAARAPSHTRPATRARLVDGTGAVLGSEFAAAALPGLRPVRGGVRGGRGLRQHRASRDRQERHRRENAFFHRRLPF